MKFRKCVIQLMVVLLLQIICVSVYGFEQSEMIKEKNPLILMYHRISDKYPSDAFTITPELFENDIKELVSLGYKFCTADELHKAIKECRTDKIVAITFDDGYKSDVELAVPILKKYNACATFFIIGSKVGTEEYLTEEDIKEMSESGVAQIGNHSFEYHEKTYDEVNELYSGKAEILLNDIIKNQNYLQSITGKKITAFSYPYGIYGGYVDSELISIDLVTFCSDETVVNNLNTAYGRFNRPCDVPLDIIIERVNSNSRSSVKLAMIQLANEKVANIKNKPD